MSDYTKRQVDRDREYAAEYEAWISSLSLEDKEEMEARGLLKPDVSRRSHAVERENDAADRAIEPGNRGIATDAPSNCDTLDAIRLITAILIGAPNMRVSALGLAYAAGLSTCSQWRNQSDAARSIGVSRQVLNKTMRQWQRLLELPPNQYTASAERREKLSEIQKEGHWRNKTFKATV